MGRLLDVWRRRFTMSDEEDAAFMQALSFLSQTGKVDLRRVMVLRSASNFTAPPPGQTAAAQLATQANTSDLSGFTESLNSTYTVGSAVVEELSRNWRVIVIASRATILNILALSLADQAIAKEAETGCRREGSAGFAIERGLHGGTFAGLAFALLSAWHRTHARAA
jgi:hypothetical protein